MKYKRGRPLTLLILIMRIEAGETVFWHNKPQNAAFLAHCQLSTLIHGVNIRAFSEADTVEGSKK